MVDQKIVQPKNWEYSNFKDALFILYCFLFINWIDFLFSHSVYRIYHIYLGNISNCFFWDYFPITSIIYILVILVTVFSGTIFPLLAHFGIKTEQVGQRLSWIYLANIIGATVGTGITGFYLMENYSITQIIFFVFTAGLILSLFVSLFSQGSKQLLGYIVIAGLFFIFVQQWHNTIFANFLEKIHFKKDYVLKGNYKFSNENRSGIIATHYNKEMGCDVIYGGGVYDSCFQLL